MSKKKKLGINVDLFIEKYNNKNKEKPITRTTLREKLGVSRQDLSNWQTGQKPAGIMVERLMAMEEMSGLHLKDFIIEIEDNE